MNGTGYVLSYVTTTARCRAHKGAKAALPVSLEGGVLGVALAGRWPNRALAAYLPPQVNQSKRPQTKGNELGIQMLPHQHRALLPRWAKPKGVCA